MKLLLDTNILLWTARNSPRLSLTARNLIENTNNSVHFSVVSLWEIVIKANLRRPSFDIDAQVLREKLIENGFCEIALESSHIFGVNALQFQHKDPFDHILFAQALTENLTLLTSDKLVAGYHNGILLV